MNGNSSGQERTTAILVVAAALITIGFNWLATTGWVGGVTPAEISDKYQTLVTPAGYAFSIWSLIYLGIIAFSIYQFGLNISERVRSIRWLFIVSCFLNCGWIYFWHHDQIAVCLALIAALAVCLFLVALRLRETDNLKEFWFAKAPFSIYFGWVTAATLVNFAIFLVSRQIEVGIWLAVALIAIAGEFGLVIRFSLRNYIYPIAIAWAVTAIAVKQSGQTAIVVTAAVVVVACLIAALSFVVGLPSSSDHNERASS